MALKAWINGDESAKEMLGRVLTERPSVLFPPLHRVPLRVGNVVEINGPSPSAKSEILIQAAINCVIPKEWKGVHYGGLERLVMYFDLDCRFDVLRLSQSLKHRIMEGNRSSNNIYLQPNEIPQKCNTKMAQRTHFDEELFVACMRRFLYIRCYNSFEFLAALKTMRYRLQSESEAQGVRAHFLMIDSISAFYQVDRASVPLPPGGTNRKNLSLQSVVETVVQEIRNLLQVQPMLVLAAKTITLGIGALTNELKRNFRKSCSQDTLELGFATSKGPEKSFYRDYMPSVWQLFVTHRINLRVSDEDLADPKQTISSVYISEWVMPPLNFMDKFTVNDSGIYMVT